MAIITVIDHVVLVVSSRMTVVQPMVAPWHKMRKKRRNLVVAFSIKAVAAW
jgi:hypothetical protein